MEAQKSTSLYYRQYFVRFCGTGIAFKLVSFIRVFRLEGPENRTLLADFHEKRLKGTRLHGQGLTLKKFLSRFGYGKHLFNLLYNYRLIRLAAL
jgi:hypothetical protein